MDINTLPLGKTEIDGDRVYLQMMDAVTHELTDRQLRECTGLTWISR
ncbi:MAG: hypothetical protein ACLTBV_01600 [Enterocloster bolteae]